MAAEDRADSQQAPLAATDPMAGLQLEQITPQQLYDRAAEQVNRLVRRLLGPDPDQDDLVNEAFLRMLRSIDQLRDPSRFHGWVNRVTVSTVRDWLRKRGVRRRHHASYEDLDTLMGSSANAQASYLALRTKRVLDQLPVDERLAFAIRHLEQLPLPQTAELCDCSLATIKRRLAKAERRFYGIASRDPLLKDLVVGSAKAQGKVSG